MKNEIWKNIIGYEGIYMVSSLGRIKSFIKNKHGAILCNPKINKYKKVTLFKNNIQKEFYAHRLIAIHFVPNPFNKKFVNHKDGIKSNIAADNLEWATPKENVIHAFKNNLMGIARGINKPSNKLREKDIINIRKKYVRWDYSSRTLSK